MSGDQTQVGYQSTDLVDRLLRQWVAWGSPIDRDTAMSEGSMAMDCREAAEEITRLRATIEGIARAIEHDFPSTAAKIRDELNNKTSWNATAATAGGGPGHG